MKEYHIVQLPHSQRPLSKDQGPCNHLTDSLLPLNNPSLQVHPKPLNPHFPFFQHSTSDSICTSRDIAIALFDFSSTAYSLSCLSKSGLCSRTSETTMIITLFSNLLSSHLCNKVKPLLAHLHPGDALSRQVRVDGGELATDVVVVDDLLDGCP